MCDCLTRGVALFAVVVAALSCCTNFLLVQPVYLEKQLVNWDCFELFHHSHQGAASHSQQ